MHLALAAALVLSQATGLTDAEIAQLAITSHEIGAERGKLAQRNAGGAAARQLGEAMVKDHERAAKELKDLAKKLELKLRDTASSKQLKAEAKGTTDQLKGSAGPGFDQAYCAAVSAQHAQLKQLLETQLIPSAQNEELKKVLQGNLPTIEGHLEFAARAAAGGSAPAYGGSGDEGTEAPASP